MANDGRSPALRVPSMPYSERGRRVPGMKDRSDDPLLWWLVVISVGCLLMALVCAATLSRFTSVPITTSSATPIDPNPCAFFHATPASLLTSARGAA
jgi:hypothetical protein